MLNDAVGAPLGSVLATAGAIPLLGVPALLHGCAAAVLRRSWAPTAATPPAHDRTGRSIRREIAEGLGHLAAHRVLRRLAVVNGVANLGNTAFFAVFVLFVVGPLDLPEAAYGGFLAAVAVGGVIGSVIADRALGRLGQGAILRVAAATAAVGYAVVSSTSSPAVVALCASVLGALSMIWNVGTRVLRQTLVPDRLLGRVTATMSLVALAATPVGAAVGGVVAEVAGIRAAGAVAVGSNLLALLLLAPITAPAIVAAQEDARTVDPRAHTAG